jgi:hypothetical protein
VVLDDDDATEPEKAEGRLALLWCKGAEDHAESGSVVAEPMVPLGSGNEPIYGLTPRIPCKRRLKSAAGSWV